MERFLKKMEKAPEILEQDLGEKWSDGFPVQLASGVIMGNPRTSHGVFFMGSAWIKWWMFHCHVFLGGGIHPQKKC